MKSHRALFGSVLLIVLLSLVGCKGPEGPQGPPGESTVLNLEGFAADIKCGNCHNPDTDTTNYVWARKYQWELSKHFYGGDFERNSSSCAGCHTTEGFIERMQGRAVTNHVDASPPGCFACHSPHARGNFTLRKRDPVVITSAITGVPDQTFDYGKGNLCVQCHQTRVIGGVVLNPKMNANPPGDSLVIATSRWYPHYGVQGQMFMGTGGFKFPGYTYTGNSNHSTNTVIKQEGCIACHMADATAGSGIAGGHTMNIEYENTSGQKASLLNGCTVSGCHSAAGFTINYIGSSSSLTGGVGTHTAVEAYLDTLFRLLGTKGWMDTDPASSSYGLLKASSSKPLVIKPAVKAGALFNYFFIEHDMSKGSHNTRYAVELLKSSIAELRKP